VTQLDRLSCEETFRRLDDYLDRELSAEEMRMVRDHLEICAVCATEFGFERAVIDRVRQKLARIDVSPDLKRRIALALERAERAEGSR
jgi:anti-sigma factor (TIGR02949 family)